MDREKNPLIRAAEGVEEDEGKMGANLYGMDSDFDFRGHEVRNALHRGFVLDTQITSAAPAAPVEGQMYFDTTLHKPRYWNGSAWLTLTGA